MSVQLIPHLVLRNSILWVLLIVRCDKMADYGGVSPHSPSILNLLSIIAAGFGLELLCSTPPSAPNHTSFCFTPGAALRAPPVSGVSLCQRSQLLPSSRGCAEDRFDTDTDTDTFDLEQTLEHQEVRGHDFQPERAGRQAVPPLPLSSMRLYSERMLGDKFRTFSSLSICRCSE